MTSICSGQSNSSPVLVFPETVLKQLVMIAEEARPREGVAALFGDPGDEVMTISLAKSLPNKARARSQFIIDIDGLNGAIALFHSHPTARSFSAQDCAQIARSTIPWVIGFPRCRRRFSSPLLEYQKWIFQAANRDGENGFQSCNLLIEKEEI